MDEENSFFTTLGRINSILFFLFILLGLGLLSFVTYKFYTDATSKRVISNIVNTQKEPTLKKKFQLSSESSLVNERYLATPLSLIQSFEHSYYSKNSTSVQNYLFTDITNSKSRWLFDTNEYLLLTTTFIQKDRFKTNPTGAKAIFTQVVKKDTNGDKRLSQKDKKSLFISKIDGTLGSILVEDLDILNTWQILDDDTLFIIYQSKGIAHSAKVNLNTFELFEKKRIFLE